MKNNRLVIVLLVFSLLLVASCGQKTQTTQTNNNNEQTPPVLPGTTTSGDVVTGKTVEISMTAKRFEFIPSTITVNQGDRVKITLTSQDTTHGFFLPDFGINEQITPGKETIVEFVAKTKGTYTFRCSVPCGSGHGSMSGTLIVE